MKQNQRLAIEKFNPEGWNEIENGWPDYLLVRSTSDNKLEFLAVEVKCKGDRLSDAQRRMHVALLSAGIKVVVVNGSINAKQRVVNRGDGLLNDSR
jgi:hypothetical protein